MLEQIPKSICFKVHFATDHSPITSDVATREEMLSAAREVCPEISEEERQEIVLKELNKQVSELEMVGNLNHIVLPISGKQTAINPKYILYITIVTT
jgi:hypothetical protein